MLHNCWECGEIMEEREVDFKDKLKGEEFEFKATGLICPNGHTSLLGIHMDAYNIILADTFRKKHGLLTTEQILNYRNKLNMSQQKFADFLGTHVQSLKHWEHGCVQDKAMDSLIRLKVEKTGLIMEEEAPYQMKEYEKENEDVKALALAA